MDLRMIEYATNIIFKICMNHPELCPHDYEWEWSKTKGNIKEEHYQCRLCGHKILKEIEL